MLLTGSIRRGWRRNPPDLGPEGTIHTSGLPLAFIPSVRLLEQSRWKPRPSWVSRHPSSELWCGWEEGSWPPPPASQEHKPDWSPSPPTLPSTWSRTQIELTVQYRSARLILARGPCKYNYLTNTKHLLRHCSCTLQTLSPLVLICTHWGW